MIAQLFRPLTYIIRLKGLCLLYAVYMSLIYLNMKARICFLVHQIIYWDILLKFFDLFLSLLFGYVFYYCVAANRCNLRRIPFHRNAAMGPMGGFIAFLPLASQASIFYPLDR